MIEKKFAVHYDAVENQLKTDTIGLVTLDQMKAKQVMSMIMIPVVIMLILAETM